MQYTTVNPSTGKPIQTYTSMKWDEIESILQDMHKAQSAWAQETPLKRSIILKKLSELLIRDHKNIAKTITEEMGKPTYFAKNEVLAVANGIAYLADHAEEYFQENINDSSIVRPLPLGNVYAIKPWNFPILTPLSGIRSALLAGNGVLFKPSENTIACGMLIESLCKEAGFPEGLIRTIIIDLELSSKIIHHPTIRAITLTGSSKTGRIVASEAGSALKPVTLELGGSDGYIIRSDVDIDTIAPQLIKGRLNNSGQICISPKRYIVHESIYQRLVDTVLSNMPNYTFGDPTEETTTMGPLARKDLRDIVHAQVQQSIKEGAKCLYGGTMPNTDGYYYPPTLLVNVTPDMTAFKEEIFGPVLCFIKAKNDDDALDLLNASPYGLGSGIYTQDIDKALQLSQYIEAGGCGINCSSGSGAGTPFGGVKASGFGREGGKFGIEEFSNIQTVSIKK